jgi:NADPH2:quinone reductase
VRAARSTEYGSIDLLRVEEVDDPVPGPDEVVVDIAAAAVNFPDLLMLSGGYQVRTPLPIIPGSEFAGTVRSRGERVERLAVGDRVAGAAMVGAFAEQIAVPAASLWPVPAGVDMAEAAAFRVTYLTSYHALRSVAVVAPGEWVVVLGAAGGVGLSVVDIAKLLGARVIAAASGPDKLAVCRERGADETIDYSREDLKTRIKEITGTGANVVIDPVGGDQAEPALRAMGWGGRYVCVGFASAQIPCIPLNLVLLKGVVICGMEMRTFGQHRAKDAARDEADLFEHFRTGTLRPLISARFDLENTAEAMRTVSERRAIGKVVITPRHTDTQ